MTKGLLKFFSSRVWSTACFVEIVTWPFGQEGEEDHRLKNSCGMAMNSKGQFIITEVDKRKIKLFDRRGRFVDRTFQSPCTVQNVDQVCLEVLDVAVDTSDNFYVLVNLRKRDDVLPEYVVYVFNNNGDVHHHFPVKGDGKDCHVCLAMIVDSKRKVV